jgi:hypothetical protein
MENNLLKTGNWYWRTGEISLKDYYTLSSASRKRHIEFLLTLKESQRSSNDISILIVSRVKEIKENIKFLEL